MGSGGGSGVWGGGGDISISSLKLSVKWGGGGSFEEDIEAVQDNIYQGLMIRA